MYKRPWSLVVLAILHLVAPITNIALNAIFLNTGIGSYFESAMSLQYISMNWPIILAPIICAFAIYACKKWSFFVYLASLATLFFFSYEGYLSKSSSLGLFPIVLVYAINILVVAYFLVPEIRQIYFNPRLRWWEISPRYQAEFDCHFSAHVPGTAKSEAQDSGHIGNFSVGGLFLRSQVFPEDNSHVLIEFPFKGQTVSFNGRVILHKHQDAVGFGVEFFHSNESKKTAKRICSYLDEKGCRIESRFKRPDDDSFTAWARTLLTTGKGFFPKKRT